MKILKKEDIKEFTLGIESGYFMWKVKLLDNIIYKIKYKIETYTTPKGNKSKRKVYFIKKDNEELIFDDEVKKMFRGFRQLYLISGILVDRRKSIVKEKKTTKYRIKNVKDLEEYLEVINEEFIQEDNSKLDPTSGIPHKKCYEHVIKDLILHDMLEEIERKQK